MAQQPATGGNPYIWIMAAVIGLALLGLVWLVLGGL
jgi:hypothetical protein